MAAGFASLLGDELLSATGPVKTEEALKGKVVGLYFSAHWCPPCKGFTPKLAGWYKDSLAAKGFEVVFISSDRDQESFDDYFKEMPWKALPFTEKSKKEALSNKYKVRGIPTLVILDEEGRVIVTDGRSAVSGDPEGHDFPWRPKPFSAILGTEFVGKGDTALGKSAVEGKVLGLYFSAHWCPPCRGFTPKLADWYKKVSPNLPDFEIIFVSSDRSEEDFKHYFGEMPWIALPYNDRKRKEHLSNHFEVQGIPTFVIVDKDGTIITTNGRGIPTTDPEGKEFPWHPKALKDLANGPDNLQEALSLVVFADGANEATRDTLKATLQPIASEHRDKAKATGEDGLQFFYGDQHAGDVLDALRRLAGRPAPPKKHPHPLEKKDRTGCQCDGCKEAIEGDGYNCGDCDFDFCADCNKKAVDKVTDFPVFGIVYNFDEGTCHIADGVDFTNTASVRDFLDKLAAGTLKFFDLSGN
jgi:nucleoredoxin